MLNPLVSIIIPSYNIAPYIGHCLKSILVQTYKNLQIIVVNDGSTDETLAVVEKVASDDSRIVIINKPNEGVSVARNYGIEAAAGDYIMFVDGDDWIDEDMVESLVDRAIQYNVDFSGAGFIFEDIDLGRTRPSRSGFSPKVLESQDILKSYFLGHYLWGSVWGGVYKTSLLNKYNIRFEREIKYGEDVFFNAQVMAKANRVIVGDEHFYHVRVRGSSATRHSVHEVTKVKEADYPAFLKQEGIWEIYKEYYYVWYLRSCNYKLYHLALKVPLKDYLNYYRTFMIESDYRLHNTWHKRKQMKLRDRVLSIFGLSSFLSWILMYIPTLFGRKIIV